MLHAVLYIVQLTFGWPVNEPHSIVVIIKILSTQFQTLQRQLIKVVDNKVENWDKYISAVLFAYRTSVQASTKYSPFYLMYNRKARLPIDIKMQGTKKSVSEQQVDIDTKNLEEQLEKILKIRSQALKNIHQAQKRQKKYYDAKHASKILL